MWLCTCLFSILYHTHHLIVILSRSHFHTPYSQHLTWLHCVCWSVNYLFVPPPWQTDMLHRSHLSKSQIVYLQLCLRVSFPHSLPPFIFFHSFIRCLLTELQLTHWQMGYYSCHLIIPNAVNVFIKLCVSVVLWDTCVDSFGGIMWSIILCQCVYCAWLHVQKREAILHA